MSDISRRNILKTLFICITSLFFSITGYTFSLILPKRQEKQEFGFDEFHLLSQLLTKTKNLNEKVSREIFGLIVSESWGVEHIRQIYNRVRSIQIQSANEKPLIIKAGDFTDSDQWFISHLLLTWYTGVYFHDMGNHNVTLKHALMYKKLANYRLPPTYCAGAPGSWKDPPVSQT